MAINYFIGLSRSDLETALAAAQQDLLSGKATTAANSGLVGIKSSVELSAAARIELIYTALSLLDPTTYPPSQISRTNILKIAFSQVGDAAAS